MSASIAIQVLPQVDNDADVCRIVDRVIAVSYTHLTLPTNREV